MNSRCDLCLAYERGLRSWTFSTDVDIKVCQAHWDFILAESQDGPYMNLP